MVHDNASSVRPRVCLVGDSLTLGWFPSMVPPSADRAKRSAVTTFSAASRRRLLSYLARLDWPVASEVLFVTLTYASRSPEGRKTKRDLDNLRRYLVHRYPRVEAVWKREYQARGSAHFHLLVRLEPGKPVSQKALREIRADLAGAWSRLAGEKCRIQVVPVRSMDRMKVYFSVYLGKKFGEKAYQDVVPEGQWSGRFWGVWGDPVLLPSVGAWLTPSQFGLLVDAVNGRLVEVGARAHVRPDRPFTTLDGELVGRVAAWLGGEGLVSGDDGVDALVKLLDAFPGSGVTKAG